MDKATFVPNRKLLLVAEFALSVCLHLSKIVTFRLLGFGFPLCSFESPSSLSGPSYFDRTLSACYPKVGARITGPQPDLPNDRNFGFISILLVKTG